MPKSFTERIAGSLDHPIEAACAARPPGMIWTAALAAGIGAAIGSIAGGSPLWAGVGGGVAALVGYLVVWLRLRGTGLSLGMALALTADRLELLRLSWLGTRAVGVIRAVPYHDVSQVDASDRLLEQRLVIATPQGPIVVHTSKRGIGAGREFAEELKRRIAA
jgi:hypothetical protein